MATAAIVAAALCLAPSIRAARTLPAALSDKEFWALSQSISEENGYFQSDNLTSNEMTLSTVAAQLAQRVQPGGVYLGVGPEQNLTYISAMRPRMAFINDIRRGNLQMHLMYKALFELSVDRIEFVSRLLTKPRPAGLTARSTAADIMNAFWDTGTRVDGTYEKNLQAALDVLRKKHGLPLPPEDVEGITTLYHTFYWCGPSINYSVRAGATSCVSSRVSWADLLMSVDPSGVEHSFLATEETFAVVKALHSRNLIVPTVGDFAGPKALRAIATYLKEHDATLSAFYVSNVEQYLKRNGVWQTFCGNVATMPLDASSVFIRPGGMGATTFSTIIVNGQTITAGRGAPQPPLPSGNLTSFRDPFSSIAQEVTANGCKS
jgi:hypothetical protein